MTHSQAKTCRAAAAAIVCASLANCSGLQPAVHTQTGSATHLAANTGDDADRVPYRYSVPTNWTIYRNIVIEPVAIYRGTDNQFGDLAEPDKVVLAAYMRTAFAGKLAERFAVVSTAVPNTLRLKLTLSGAVTNTPLISPFTHLDVAGNVIKIVQAVRGREGLVAGSIVYDVEVFDTPSNRLLLAYVTKQYPNAMNVVASLGSLSASKTGIDNGADMLLSELR